ncbi:hypothetical protein HFD88_007831 [Aspergillus terreus]|nr:hypothetical protein HFD88_007831 [Aspergillus terreus]
MVVYYQLAGKKVGSHVVRASRLPARSAWLPYPNSSVGRGYDAPLAMGVLGSLFGGVFLATRGGDKQKQTTPPIQASSKDEETFIQDFLKQVNGEEKKSDH